MDYYLISFVSVIFGTLIMIKETRCIRRNSTLLLINVFGYMYALTYGFLPACVLILYDIKKINLSYSYYTIDYSTSGVMQILIWILLGVLGYLAVQFSYRSRWVGQQSTLKLKVKEQSRSINLSKLEKKDVWGTLQITMIICLIISVISLFLWTKAYGGILNLILIADKVRDGVANVQNPIAFFARPAKMILISSYMALILVKNRYNTFINSIFLSISLVFSLLMLLALDGRFGMAIHVLSIVLLAQNHLEISSFSWKKLKKLAIISGFALVAILYLDSVTFYIRNGYWKVKKSTETFLEELFSEFSYIFTGAQHSVESLLNGDCPYLVGHDILAGVFAWVPTSLRPDGIINIWNFNTELCTIGDTIYGQLPCDFITTSVYAIGIFGPLVYGLFWGWIIKQMDCWYLKSNDTVAIVFYCMFFTRILKLPNYCLLYDFILGLFSIVLAALIWLGCKHVKLKHN